MGPVAYEHGGSAELAVRTCQSLVALGCVWSGSADPLSQSTVTEFDPRIKLKLLTLTLTPKVIDYPTPLSVVAVASERQG